MPQRTMNVEQVARYLHMLPVQVERLVKQGDIPVLDDQPRARFRRREIDAWASRRILGMAVRPLAEYHRETSGNTRADDGSHPLISSLLSVEGTMDALASRTRSAILHDLTARAEALGLLYDPKCLLRSLEAREALCSTGLSGGVAVPHPRHHDPYLASSSFILLARSTQPIHYGAPDGRPTDIFLLLVCQDDQMHLHALARICSLFQATDLAANLRGADSAAAMHAAIAASEQTVLETLP